MLYPKLTFLVLSLAVQAAQNPPGSPPTGLEGLNYAFQKSTTAVNTCTCNSAQIQSLSTAQKNLESSLNQIYYECSRATQEPDLAQVQKELDYLNSTVVPTETKWADAYINKRSVFVANALTLSIKSHLERVKSGIDQAAWCWRGKNSAPIRQRVEVIISKMIAEAARAQAAYQ